MLEQVVNFVIGDTVIYNPNMPNLKPFYERLYDIAKVIGFEGDYVKIQFRNSGFISIIDTMPLYPNDVPFPVYTTYALTKLNQEFDIDKIDE